MNTIYLLAKSQYLDSISDEFATSEEELAKIASNHAGAYFDCEPEAVRVEIDMGEKTVMVALPSGCIDYYDIHTIKRVS